MRERQIKFCNLRELEVGYFNKTDSSVAHPYRLLESLFSSSASVKLQAARKALCKKLDEREGVAAVVGTVFSTFSHYLPGEYKRYRL